MSNSRYDLIRPGETAGGELSRRSDLDFVCAPALRQNGEYPLTARLLYVSSAKYERDWHSILHTHSFSELFYITGGHGQFLVEGQRYQIGSDDLVIINPHVEHTEMSMNINPLEYIVLGIEGLCFDAGNSGESNCAIMNCGPGRSEMRFYLRTLLREVQESNHGKEVMCQSLLNLILIHILRNETLHLTISKAEKASRECALVRRYIDAHFKEPLTLDDLAGIAHLNKYYMAHDFKDTYGIAPINYLLERRVEEAKYLLEQTDYSLSRIASILGFSSASYFSQSFKRIAHITPNGYRAGAGKK